MQETETNKIVTNPLVEIMSYPIASLLSPNHLFIKYEYRIMHHMPRQRQIPPRHRKIQRFSTDVGSGKENVWSSLPADVQRIVLVEQFRQSFPCQRK